MRYLLRVPSVWFGVGMLMLRLSATAANSTEFDAAFVNLTAPDQIPASGVFAVTITMRNTGTQPWEGWPIRMRSIDPTNNTVWGTDYILIAQGSVVQPGSNYVFRSNLRAPSEAGSVSFRWQVCKDATLWFGSPTPARAIEVQVGQASASLSISPPPNADGKAMLRPVDFEYVGSFKPPKTVNSARGAFSEAGIAYRSMPDGRDRLFINYTHPSQVLFEVEIPLLVRIVNGNHDGLKTAAIKQIWGPLSVSVPGENPLSPNGGFVWNEPTRTLLWTCYDGYRTGSAPPQLGATTLPDGGAATSFGPWRVTAPQGLYKSYWGGLLRLPTEFANRYTGGRTLALGFGGYYSICAPASRGPALGAIPELDPAQTSVPVTPLLYCPVQYPAPRDGNYFDANCGFWNNQPRDPDHGTWTYDDYCRAGVWIETPSAHAYLALVRLGTGRLGYDFGSITSGGDTECWYLYNPKDLGETAAGLRQPWRVVPSSMTKVDYPLGVTVTGACYNPKSQLLYLCVSWAYPDGRESYPIIHAYHVGGASAAGGANLEINWTGSALESSAGLGGAWSEIPNAPSPYWPQTEAVGPQQFYRARQ